MIALTCHSNWVPPWNTITMNLLIKTGIHRLIALTQFIGLGPKSSRQVTWHTTISSQPALLLSCEKGHAVSASAWSSDPIWSTHSALLLTINKLGGWKTHYLSWDSGADGPCLLRGAMACPWCPGSLDADVPRQSIGCHTIEVVRITSFPPLAFGWRGVTTRCHEHGPMNAIWYNLVGPDGWIVRGWFRGRQRETPFIYEAKPNQ